MADKKISELTALTGANVATDDQLVIVDTSAALTKNITIDEFKNALDTATGFVRITGDTMTGDLSMSGANITLGDSSGVSDDRIVLGDDSDLLIYHNNPNSFIRDQGNGNFFITTDGNYIFLAKDDLTNMATFQVDGPVDLYHAGSAKLATTSTGIAVTGDATFADNGKAIFGAGSDLQIYHDGTNSWIEEHGGGDLYIEATNLTLRALDNTVYATFADAGASTIYHAGAQKFTTTSTGVDITGTLTSDGLTVDGTFNFTSAVNGIINNPASFFINIDSDNNNAGEAFYISRDAENTAGARVAKFDATGDISFYDSLGSSQSFFWDASAESLGIGTTSPDKLVHLKTSVNNTAVLRIESTATDSYPFLSLKNDAREYQLTAHGPLGDVFTIYDGTAGSHRFVIDSSGNVIINNNAGASDAGTLRITGGTSGLSNLQFADTADGNIGMLQYNHTSNYMLFQVNNAEAMRLNASGDLLVSLTSSTDNTGVGHRIREDGLLTASRDGTATQATAGFNKVSNDGDIVHFNKNGVKVGSIGIESGGLVIDGESGHTGLRFANDAVLPRDNGATTNGEDDLGSETSQWRNLYLSSSIILKRAESASVGTFGRNTDGTARTLFTFRSESQDATVGTITVTNSATAYNTSSDYRLKTDAQPMTGATDRLKQLNPVNFEWIADGTRVDGFLAHEAQVVVPEAVTGAKDAMRDEEYEVTPAVLDDDGNVVTEAVMGTRSVPDYQGIDQSKLVPLLVATIKELEARITALENA